MRWRDEIVELLGCPRTDILRTQRSGLGKALWISEQHCGEGAGTEGDPDAPASVSDLRLRVQSVPWHHRLFQRWNGTIHQGEHVKFINTGREYDADEVGVLKLDFSPRPQVSTGDVGYIISGIKTSRRSESRRYNHLSGFTCYESHCRLRKRSNRWSLPVYIHRSETSRICVRHSKTAAQRCF